MGMSLRTSFGNKGADQGDRIGVRKYQSRRRAAHRRHLQDRRSSRHQPSNRYPAKRAVQHWSAASQSGRIRASARVHRRRWDAEPATPGVRPAYQRRYLPDARGDAQSMEARWSAEPCADRAGQGAVAPRQAYRELGAPTCFAIRPSRSGSCALGGDSQDVARRCECLPVGRRSLA